MLRTVLLLLMACSLSSASTILTYDVEIDTSLTGSQASLLLTLFDNDPGVATSLAVTDVKGVKKEGYSIQTGNVSGSFAGGTLLISDGFPSYQFVNGYLELFAIFDEVLNFRITFETEEVPNADLALFGMRGRSGAVVDLFSFDGANQLTIYNSEYVSARAVSVPEPPATAELVLLLGLVGLAGLIRKQRKVGRSGISRAPVFG